MHVNEVTVTYLNDTFMIEQLQALPVLAEHVAIATHKDPLLGRV